MLGPERRELLDLLAGLTVEQWAAATECPGWDVQGIATHVLGDDLSLLSRQRDAQVPGIALVATDHPGLDLRGLLDAFNDGWVHTARFLSPALVIELLRTTGDWTAAFYGAVDLDAPCEPVGFFGSTGGPAPYWQAIAREYVERWVHHSQIRRAVGMPSLAHEPFVRAGVEVVAAAAGAEPRHGSDGWHIGSLALGGDQQAADVLTRAHTADELRALLDGPADAVDLAVAAFARPDR